MKTKILLTIILGIFLISLASAEVQTLGTFKRYECVGLIQTCSNCTYINISNVIYPDSSVALSENVMTKDNTFYNYTFCNTSQLGEYIVNGFGDPDGEKTTWTYNLFITETGIKDKSILDNAMLIVLIALALLFLMIGIKTGTVWLGFMSAVMFMLGGLYMTIYGLNDITNMYTQGIGITIIGVGITILFVSIYEGFLDHD